MKLNRQFASPWPAVLAEMKDFVELARLAAGGGYRNLRVSVKIPQSVPLSSLTSPPVEQFCQWLEAIPRCPRPPQGFFAKHGHTFHRIDLDIEN